MKLILCKNCKSIVSASRTTPPNKCDCGESYAYYKDKINAVYGGRYAIPLGIANNSLDKAIENQPKEGDGYRFNAFVIPENCATFKKI